MEKTAATTTQLSKPIELSAFSNLSPFAAVAGPPPSSTTTAFFFDATAASAAAAAAETSAAVRASETVTAEAAALLARSRSTPGSLSCFFGGGGEATTASFFPRSASFAAAPPAPLRDPLSVLRSAAATPHDPSPLEHLTRKLEIRNNSAHGELEIPPPPLALASVAAAAVAAQPGLSALIFSALAALAGSNAAGVAAASDFERRTREAAARAAAAVPALPLRAPTATAPPPPPPPLLALDPIAATGKKRRVSLSPPYDPELLLRYASAGVQVTLATETNEEQAAAAAAAVGTPTSRLAKETGEAEDESHGGEEEEGQAAEGIRVVASTELRPHPTALPRIRISAVRAASMPSLTSLLLLVPDVAAAPAAVAS